MQGDILIVEDESAIADTIAYALGTEGFVAHRCECGGQALERLAAGTFKLVILDVGLPDLSGFEVCRRLRTFSRIPVIFLTARSEEVDRIVGLEIGADDYVGKPFSPRELVARVRAVLRRLDGPVVAVPQLVPQFQVDEAALRIRYCGLVLELTRYEYRLLRTLLTHPERVFTRAELLERVWAEAEDSTERTVDTHIKTLRAKLKAVNPDQDPIQTHRGVGYSTGQVSCA